MPMTLYRNFVRMNTGFMFEVKDNKAINKELKAVVKRIKKLDFVYADMYIECIEAEKLIYTNNFAKGIAKMEDILSKYGDENPTLRSNFLYTLILSNYLRTKDAPCLENVLKIAADNLRINPSKVAVAYYAAVNQAAGKFEEAYSALSWMHFYQGSPCSNAVYDKMNVNNFRGKFPLSTKEAEAEKLRARTLLRSTRNK